MSLRRVGFVTAAFLASAFLGGCFGFLVTRLLVEGVGIVEGPPAGVLLVLSVAGFAVVGGVLGLILAVRWLRKHRTDTL